VRRATQVAQAQAVDAVRFNPAPLAAARSTASVLRTLLQQSGCGTRLTPFPRAVGSGSIEEFRRYFAIRVEQEHAGLWWHSLIQTALEYAQSSAKRTVSPFLGATSGEEGPGKVHGWGSKPQTIPFQCAVEWLRPPNINPLSLLSASRCPDQHRLWRQQ